MYPDAGPGNCRVILVGGRSSQGHVVVLAIHSTSKVYAHVKRLGRSSTAGKCGSLVASMFRKSSYTHDLADLDRIRDRCPVFYLGSLASLEVFFSCSVTIRNCVNCGTECRYRRERPRRIPQSLLHHRQNSHSWESLVGKVNRRRDRAGSVPDSDLLGDPRRFGGDDVHGRSLGECLKEPQGSRRDDQPARI